MRQSTTARMESNELDRGRSMMKSKILKTMVKQGPIMAKEVHEGNGEDYLHKHKHHMISQVASRTSKVMATNSHETLIPWSY
jgi:hypothetical protein